MSNTTVSFRSEMVVIEMTVEVIIIILADVLHGLIAANIAGLSTLS